MAPRVGHAPAIRLGRLVVDRLDQQEAVAAIGALVREGQGARVFTPNLDHIRLAEEVPAFRAAYSRATISLADGMPLVWASRLFGVPLRERVSGADLIVPVCALAGREGWRVFLLGGAPGVAEDAGRRLATQCGVEIVGCLSPSIDIENPGEQHGDRTIIEALRQAQPDLVFVALGSPKQELWIDRVADALAPMVLVGIGAGLDFLAGRVTRAPAWVGRLGFEWLYRLLSEPTRLWRRYLVAGPRAVWYLLRTPLSSRTPPPLKAR